jgi:hypothetical protein
MPGFGSLIGGRQVGYVQAGVYLVSFAVTLVLGMRFIYWALQNWSWLHGEQEDFSALAAMWKQARWPLAGILGFLVSWLWALATSFSILNSVPKTAPSPIPPKL